MAVRNRDIVAILNEIADLLAIQDANSFRIRSYRSAARTVEGLDEEVADLVEEGRDLTELPDIGESIADKLDEIVRTGSLAQLDELQEELDEHVTELLHIQNIGPAGARKLYEELGITDAEGVVRAAEEGRIAGLDGFGTKTEEQLLHDARRFLESGSRDRLPLGDADDMVGPLLDHLNAHESIRRAVAAGSYRRRKETIGDLDVVAVCDDQDRRDGRLRRIRTCRERDLARLNSVHRGAAVWTPRRPEGGRRGELWFGALLLHGKQGTQYRHAPSRAGPGPEDQRVRRTSR